MKTKIGILTMFLSLSLVSCTTNNSELNSNNNSTQKPPISSPVITEEHELHHSEGVEPTCEEEGKREYWYCSICYEYFADANATIKLDYDDITLKPLGHNYINGICSRCGEYEESKRIWFEFSDDEDYYIVYGRGSYVGENIVIPETYKGLPVKEIRAQAFSGDETLEEVTIPSSIAVIPKHSFSYCNQLKKITFESSPEEVYPEAFSGSKALQSFVINNKNGKYYVENNHLINSETKTIVRGIPNQTIPNDIVAIGDYAFSSYDTLTELTLPDSVETIGAYSFASCKNLTSIHLTSVKDINEGALEYCASLVTLDMPKVENIGEDAFYNCESLTELTLPSTIKTIGEAFSFTKINKVNYLGSVEQYCNVVLPDNSYPLDNVHKAKLYFNGELVGPHLVIPEGITKLYHNAFSNQSSILSVSLPSTLVDINYTAFENCSSIIYVENKTSIDEEEIKSLFETAYLISNDSASQIEIIDDGDGFIKFLDKNTGECFIAGYDFEQCPTTSLTFPEDIDGHTYKIKSNAFINNSTLKTVIIPSGCVEIGEYAFYQTDLSQLTIDGVNTIGEYAFSYCEVLESLTLNEGIEHIGYRAFMIGGLSFNEGFYKTLVIPDSVIDIGEDAFYGVESLETITINNTSKNLQQIGPRAFSKCRSVNSISFANKDPWFVSDNDDFTNPIEVDVSDDAVNTTLFLSKYSEYIWRSSI